jgi:hypothetical protein
MRRMIVLVLCLSACAGKDTPPDAWVFRPPEGQPSLIEAVEKAWSEDPVGTAYGIGQLIGLVGALVLTLAGR